MNCSATPWLIVLTTLSMACHGSTIVLENRDDICLVQQFVINHAKKAEDLQPSFDLDFGSTSNHGIEVQFKPASPPDKPLQLPDDFFQSPDNSPQPLYGSPAQATPQRPPPRHSHQPIQPSRGPCDKTLQSTLDQVQQKEMELKNAEAQQVSLQNELEKLNSPTEETDVQPLQVQLTHASMEKMKQRKELEKAKNAVKKQKEDTLSFYGELESAAMAKLEDAASKTESKMQSLLKELQDMQDFEDATTPPPIGDDPTTPAPIDGSDSMPGWVPGMLQGQ